MNRTNLLKKLHQFKRRYGLPLFVAATVVCVSWISMEGTSDIGYYFDKDQTGGNPWENMEAAWRQSPLKYADHCKTPTLFIHSDQDYRCYMAEGLQMFSALRVHGVTTRMCLFHGENHELSRSGRPDNRITRLEEILGWFEKYLK